MLRRFGCLVLAGVLASTLCTTAQAQWKWRDKGGQLHISDLPPPADVPEKDVLQRPDLARQHSAPVTAAPAAASTASSAIDPELQARMKKAQQERDEKKKQEEEKLAIARAENCARAREQLRTLESGMRVARFNDKGEREFMDDQTRAAEAQRAKAVVASDCR
jgi:hypothetical protein